MEISTYFVNDMKRNKDNGEHSKDVLDSFVLIDEAVDLSTQEEYFSFSETIDFGNVDYEEVKCLRESSITSWNFLFPNFRKRGILQPQMNNADMP